MTTAEPELKLKRFLYLCSENSRYIASKQNSNDFCQLTQVQSIFELIVAKKEESILKLIKSVNSDPLCAQRATLLYVLAVCTNNFDEKEKGNAYDAVLDVCASTQELFLFIKFSHALNKNFSHGLRRIIRSYYLKSKPSDLTRIITYRKSYYGWTHKDIMKQIHIKTKDLVQDILITYSLRNLEEAKKKIDDNSKCTTESKDVIDKLEKLDAFKHCQDEEKAIKLLKESNFELPQFPAPLLKSQLVWEAIIPTLEIPVLLSELGRLNRLGFLKTNSSTLSKVADVLSDSKKCQACKIHPAQVLIHLKTLERGKPIDPQKKAYFAELESKTNKSDEETSDNKKSVAKEPTTHGNLPKNNPVIGALYKLLQCSYRNLHSTGRRVMITLDVRDAHMNRECFENKSVTCIEAATILALSFVKIEKDVTVAVFNESNVTPVAIDKSMTFSQAQQKIKESTSGHILLTSPMAWALENKKQIDVFINLIGSPDSLQRIPKHLKTQEDPIGILKRYRKTMRLVNTKMITVSLGSRKLSIVDGSPHILDVCGFDHNVPKVIEACCKGVLQ